MALDMGARYAAAWTPACTHLVCAFADTPKYTEVKRASGSGGAVCLLFPLFLAEGSPPTAEKGGIIVKQEWVLDQHKQQQALRIEPYLFSTRAPALSDDDDDGDYDDDDDDDDEWVPSDDSDDGGGRKASAVAKQRKLAKTAAPVPAPATLAPVVAASAPPPPPPVKQATPTPPVTPVQSPPATLPTSLASTVADSDDEAIDAEIRQIALKVRPSVWRRAASHKARLAYCLSTCLSDRLPANGVSSQAQAAAVMVAQHASASVATAADMDTDADSDATDAGGAKDAYDMSTEDDTTDVEQAAAADAVAAADVTAAPHAADRIDWPPLPNFLRDVRAFVHRVDDVRAWLSS